MSGLPGGWGRGPGPRPLQPCADTLRSPRLTARPWGGRSVGEARGGREIISWGRNGAALSAGEAGKAGAGAASAQPRNLPHWPTSSGGAPSPALADVRPWPWPSLPGSWASVELSRGPQPLGKWRQPSGRAAPAPWNRTGRRNATWGPGAPQGGVGPLGSWGTSLLSLTAGDKAESGGVQNGCILATESVSERAHVPAVPRAVSGPAEALGGLPLWGAQRRTGDPRGGQSPLEPGGQGSGCLVLGRCLCPVSLKLSWPLLLLHTLRKQKDVLGLYRGEAGRVVANV